MSETPLRILHVEDVAADAELSERELVKEGIEFEILRVETREAFLAALADFGPDLILSDYRLPEFDGMQALLLAREHAPGVPVIITTGSVNEETAVACMKAGAADYVLKENLGRLGTAVQSALERKRLEEDRRHAEHALRESEDRYRSLFNASTDAIITIGEDGRIAGWNRSAERLFGYPAAEVTGQPATVVVPQRYRDRHLAGIDRAKSGGESHIIGRTVEIEGLRRDGTEFPLELSLTAWKVATGRFYTAIIRDITARRAVEARNISLNRLLRTITEANELLVRATNEESLLKDVCRILVSHGGYALAWVGRADKETMRVVPVASAGDEAGYLQRIEVRWDDTPEGRGPLGIAIREGRSAIVSDVQADRTAVPWRGLHPTPGFGSIAAIPIRRGGAVTAGLIVYAWEVSFVDQEEVGLLEELAGDLSFALDTLDAREALRESEERYRSLFATSLDAVLLTTPGGEILSANAAACRMFGRSEEELMRVGRAAVVDPSDPRVPAGLGERARTGAFHGEVALLRSDQTKFSGEISTAVFADRHGRQCTSMVIRDVTDRMQLEAQLRQAQKMEAVGRLAGGVAHDFNNLLTVIQGYAELLRAPLADEPERRESVGEIVRAAERASALTRQLLAFSRRQVLEMRILDLRAVVADTEKMLKRLIGEDIEVVVVKPATLGRVKADPGQIEQVLLNLAVNSRDAMPGGGRLTLELADVNLDAPFTAAHDAIPPGRYVVISMSDTGCGMDAETVGQIFEPFFTTKELGKGTGLGLATVYGIVRQTGGYIGVETAPGAGTTFRVYLPRSAEAMASGIGPSVLSRHGTETVLLVEDEAAVRNLARVFLERKGYVVLAAQDGAAALDLVDKHTGVIHVLLTDLVMPGMSGRDLAAAVRARRPTIKVVFMSGYPADIPTELGTQGAPAFLSKPFNEHALTSKLREVLDTPGPEPGSTRR